MDQSFKWKFHRIICGASPAVVKLKIADHHDLVLGVYQNCEPSAMTTPTTQSFLILHMTKQSFHKRYITRPNYAAIGKNYKRWRQDT